MAWPVPSHYLNQCWRIFNLTLGDTFQWNLNQNKKNHSRKSIRKFRLQNGGNLYLSNLPICWYNSHFPHPRWWQYRWQYHKSILFEKKDADWTKWQLIPIHKSQNASVPYPTILHSEQKCAHFCTEWSIVGYGTDAFWDLWDWSIAGIALK